MPINILMPALSPTMEKGNLAKWLKKEGDKVKSGDVIAEIETDKATMEVEAVDEGTIAKILVPEGTQDVPVNDIIAVLAGDGEDVKAAASAGGGAAPAAKPAEAPKPAEAAKPAPAAAPEPKPAAAPAPQPAAAPAAQANGHARIFSSPLARRLAKEANIEIARIAGTGPHGRVVARDVEEAKSGKGLKAPAAAPAAAGPSIAPSMSDKQILALYEPGSYEIVPHDGMRRTIAQRLTASVQTIPHFYLTIDCDIGKLLAARARARKLKPEEYQGGTTAVSNLGMYGINHFTAVINPPHASILAVGTSEERPVVRGGKIEIAQMMSVTLSCDHRAIDGALGAELIGAFKQLIENPVMMMV